MSLNERATIASLDAARAVFKAQIESNHGRVVDTAGDSVLAIFQTATGAVQAALAIQGELTALAADMPEERQLHFRIGIQLGDVIEKSHGPVYGDGVNIAARLQSLAEPGGVMVSESVRAAVRGVAIGFADRGMQAVKNMPEPVRAYSVVGGGSGKSRPASAVADLSLPDKPSI